MFEYGVKKCRKPRVCGTFAFADFVYYGFERLASFCVAAKPEAYRAKIKSRVNSQPKSCRIYI